MNPLDDIDLAQIAARKKASKEAKKKMGETLERIKAEHPTPPDVPEKKRDLFEEMYPILAKKLRRKNSGAEQH